MEVSGFQETLNGFGSVMNKGTIVLIYAAPWVWGEAGGGTGFHNTLCTPAKPRNNWNFIDGWLIINNDEILGELSMQAKWRGNMDYINLHIQVLFIKKRILWFDTNLRMTLNNYKEKSFTFMTDRYPYKNRLVKRLIPKLKSFLEVWFVYTDPSTSATEYSEYTNPNLLQ